MPIVTAPSRGNSNGEVVTEFVDTVSTTPTTYKFQTMQEKLKVKNNGYAAVQVTVNGATITLLPTESKEFYGSIDSFIVASSGGVQSFEVGGSSYKDEELQLTGRNYARMWEDLNCMRNTIAFPDAKGLVSIRFDDNDQSFYNNAFPALRDRAFPATLSFASNRLGTWSERPKCSDSQIREMCMFGFELASHSHNHTDTPKTMGEIQREIVDSKIIWERDIGFTVRNFVEPGDWQSGSGSPNIASDIGKYLQLYYSFYEGYIGKQINSRPTSLRYGVNHHTGDGVTLDTMKGWIDQVAGKNKAVIIMCHYVGDVTPGITLANFVGLLDYIKEKRDAGLLDMVTDSGLMAAQIGTTINHINNGDFEKDFYDFIVTGSPTITTNLPHSGTKAAVLTNTSYLRYVIPAEYDSRTYRISFWHRSDTTGIARLIAAYPNSINNIVTANSNTTWIKLETCVQLPINTPLTLYFQPPGNGGTVVYDDIEITRIG